MKVTNEELLQSITDAQEEVDGYLRLSDYEEKGEYSQSLVYSRFDSWGNALEQAKQERQKDSEQNINRYDGPEDILEDVRLVADKLGSYPTSREYTKLGEYTSDQAKHLFGSWESCLDKAELDIKDKRQFTPEYEKPPDELLHKLRNINGLTSVEISEIYGCDRKTVARWLDEASFERFEDINSRWARKLAVNGFVRKENISRPHIKRLYRMFGCKETEHLLILEEAFK